MLRIYYFCCRNSLCEVLEKEDAWPEACLAVLNRFHAPPAPRRRKDGPGLCSVPTGTSRGISGSASAGPWPGLVGFPGGEEGLKEAPSSAAPGKGAGAVPQPRYRGVGRWCSASEGS